MKKDYNCVFCKIVDGLIPCYKLYEDDYVLAFLDINPVTYGHTLVITKDHYETFLSLPKEEIARVMSVAQKIGQVLMRKFGAKGVNYLMNCYESAGQEVKHFHMHVIPRYIAKEGFQISMQPLDSNSLQLPTLQENIINELNKE